MRALLCTFLSLLLLAGYQTAFALSTAARGFVYFEEGKTAEALRTFQRALLEAQKNDDLEKQSFYNLNIAHIHIGAGQAREARPYLQAAAKLHQQLGDKEGLAMVQLEAGRFALVAGKTDSARLSFEDALSMFGEQKNTRGITITKNELGLLETEAGQYEKARAYFNEACEKNTSEKLFRAAATNLSNIGRTYLLEKNYAKAEEILLQAVAMDKKQENTKDLPVTFLHLAFLYSQTDRCQQAEMYFRRASAIGIPASLKEESESIRKSCQFSDR